MKTSCFTVLTLFVVLAAQTKRTNAFGAGCICTWPLPIVFCYHPVCGDDSRTYLNECAARCAGHHAVCKGRCPCDRVPPKPIRIKVPFSIGPIPPPTRTEPTPHTITPGKPTPSTKIPGTKKDRPVSPEECKCPEEFDPVCGSDGHDYSTVCLMLCAGVKLGCEGPCPCQGGLPGWTLKKAEACAVLCKKDSLPVCGADGKDYFNDCEAKCYQTPVACYRKCPCVEPKPAEPAKPSNITKEPGESGGGKTTTEDKLAKCIKECPSDEPSVCGEDDKEYASACVAQCYGVKAECEEKCPCPTEPETPLPTSAPLPAPGPTVHGSVREVKPATSTTEKEIDDCLKNCPTEVKIVCGTDGKDYKSACHAKCHKIDIKCEEKCPCPTQPVEPHGKNTTRCSECEDTYDPVCGSDDKSYNNLCLLQCENVSLACTGTCPCDEKTKTKGETPDTGSKKLEPDVSANDTTPVTTEGRPKGEREPGSVDCTKPCTDLYDPVCGADGKTYKNKCQAVCTGKTTVACNKTCPCHTGGSSTTVPAKKEMKPKATKASKYDCTKLCPQIYDPVCGADEDTYDNECEAVCTGKTTVACNKTCPCHTGGSSTEEPKKNMTTTERVIEGTTTGEPDCTKPCPNIFAPVCGKDFISYYSICHAVCEGKTTVACIQTCPCPSGGSSTTVPAKKETKPKATKASRYDCTKPCPQIYDPVCGVDEDTYDNECEAICTGETAVKCEGRCPCKVAPKETENIQGVCSQPCVMTDRTVVCGGDGKTYRNRCLAVCVGRTHPICKTACPCAESDTTRGKLFAKPLTT